MLMNGQSTRDTYGPMVFGSQNKDAAQDVYLRGFHLGEGLLLFRIQDKLMSFLVRCTELLLQDMGLPDEAIDARVATPHSSLSIGKGLANSGVAKWRLMMESNTKAILSSTATFAIERLWELAAAKRDEAEDELWALREDPAYFQAALQDRFERIARRHGRRPRVICHGVSVSIWRCVALRRHAGMLLKIYTNTLSSGMFC